MANGEHEEIAIEGEIVDDAPASLALDPITRAEIDIQVATAKRFPRSIARVKADMIAMATLDEETAESCYYSLKRTGEGGDKPIQGPSIRLAEIALSCFGNVRAGTRTAGETEDGRFVREIGFCHDVQNNVAVAREVKRRITKRDGRRFGDDMIGVTMAAAGSIALRNAILTVVPRALVRPAYLKAKEVAIGKAKSLTVRRGEIVARLAKVSPLITTDRILAAVGKASIEEVGWPEVEHLIGLGTAIKEGLQEVEEAFPAPQKTAGEELAASKRAAAKPAKGEAAPGPEPEAKTEPTPANNGGLAADQLAELTSYARTLGVAWAAVEEAMGGPVAAGEPVSGPAVRTAIDKLKRAPK